MTRRGKRGKLKKRVSHSFHRAWKSGEEHAGFPHFHRPSDGSLSQASGARRPCSPPSKAVISRLLFSLRHFKLTGGIRCTFPIPPRQNGLTMRVSGDSNSGYAEAASVWRANDVESQQTSSAGCWTDLRAMI